MKESEKLMQIGELAEKAGACIHTIRYYEDEGLLEKPQRSNGGFRLYSNEAVERLRFIRQAQRLGLTLAEIKKIIQSSKQGLKPCCSFVKEVFEKKIKEFERNITEMNQMKKNLEQLLSEWVPIQSVKKGSYNVCPQFDRRPKKKKAGR